MNLASGLIESLEGKPKNVSDRFLAVMCCKTLVDLCESARAMLHEIKTSNCDMSSFPSETNLQLCQNVLSGLYKNDMIREDDELGIVPNWSGFNSSEGKRLSQLAFKIYACIKRNVTKEIEKACDNHDETYFVNHFDDIFRDMPFKDSINKFKAFLVSPDLSSSHKELAWEYFDALMDVVVHGQEILDDMH